MINSTLIWFLLFPIIWAAAIWWFTGHRRDGIFVAAGYLVVFCLVVALAFWASKGSATADVEIWNGQVTSKERLHGTYERSYDCRCRQVESCLGSGTTRSCSSSQVCDTCYETRYTVNWNCETTVGGFTIDSRDTTFRSVYNEPNPARWTVINPGDPVSRRNSYTNFVQAVPSSLFSPSNEALRLNFAKLTPSYPDVVYDFYRNDKFLTPGHPATDARAWNDSIAEMLKVLGPRKQVNAIVVIAKTDDPNYVYALRDAWQGANKNDVVLVIGSAVWPKIDFVDVISWTKHELFKVQLRDEVMALGVIEREAVINILASQISTNFVRRQMSEFAYLEAEIDPPNWVLLTLLVLMGAGSYATVFFYNRARPSRSFRPATKYRGPR